MKIGEKVETTTEVEIENFDCEVGDKVKVDDTTFKGKLTGESVAIELARKVPARNSNGVIEEMNVIQYKILIDNFLPRKMYLMTTASFVKKINE